MLNRAALTLHVPRDRAVLALGLTFVRHMIGGKTAALIGRAMTNHHGPDHERPAPERAARNLIARGQPAYATAIAGELERMQAAEAARPARWARTAERLRPIVDRDGPQAAEFVADYWRRHGEAPSPVTLAHKLGWPTRHGDVWGICALLVEAGWLEIHGNMLRPTPGPVVRGGPS